MNDKRPTHHTGSRFNFDDTPTFDQAQVPAFMLQLEIDSLPANQAFFLEPDSIPTYNGMPAMVVDKKSGRLHLIGSTEVEPAQAHTTTPLAKVAIMRVETITSDGAINSFFVADLRFIENHKLIIVDDLEDAPTEQEDFNRWMECKEDLREVVAFIAPVPDDATAIKKGIVPATYYGPEEYYGALDDLRLHGDTLMKKSLKRQRRQKKLAKTATKEPTSDNSGQTPTADPKKSVPLIIFSNKE